MSELLDEAKKNYEQWKECKPPIAPPREKYSYEEACQSMWHDGCNNTYQTIIGLIEKHEKPKGLLEVCPPEWMNKYLILNEKQQEIYVNIKIAYEENYHKEVEEDGDIVGVINDNALTDTLKEIADFPCIEKDLLQALRKFLSEVE